MPGVLHVCTANRCRSPIAELLMRAAFPRGLVVSSAGTSTRGGEGLWPGAEDELRALGVPTDGFRSRSLTAAMVADADLVLTATREHRDTVAALEPSRWRRVFTWRELAWLVEGVERREIAGTSMTDRLSGLADVANARRGGLLPLAPEHLDVADPVGAPVGAVAQSIGQIFAALATPSQLL